MPDNTQCNLHKSGMGMDAKRINTIQNYDDNLLSVLLLMKEL